MEYEYVFESSSHNACPLLTHNISGVSRILIWGVLANNIIIMRMH